ncbi:alpha/beta hydrolase [Sphingobacterium hungaricum]|nr:alpha/beta hydrolase [Sphingobacterium hungaricum]
MTKLRAFQFLNILIIYLLSVSCSKDEHIEIYPTNQLYSLKNVSYGQDPLQKMDIYLPPGRSMNTTKIAVFIHGGGWEGGDKDDLILNQEIINGLMQEFPGYALVNLNYRLVKGNQNQYPAAEIDVQMAMDFIYSNLDAYQVSTETYMAGFSAGAHLAALHTLKHNDRGYIKGCIAMSGVYDFTADLENESDDARRFVEQFLGGTKEEKAKEYQDASPIHYVSANSPKFYIVHGTNDELVSIGQATAFEARLKQQNVSVLTFYHQDNHGIGEGSLSKLLADLKSFLN